MSLIYVTGISGAGKSAVCKELTRRGYKAFDTDKDGIAYFYDTATGEPVVDRIPPEARTPEWRAKHVWIAKRETVERLAKDSQGQLAFLCGVTSNDADELWDLFSQVFALHIDGATLRHRITSRTGNDFGRNPSELADLLEWQKTAEGDYKKLGATLIDATQSLDKVVDRILANVKS